jgi:hypothetical protein
MQTVCDQLGVGYPGTTLSYLFSIADPTMFDPRYEGNHTLLSHFANYGGIYLKLSKTSCFFTTVGGTQYITVQSTGTWTSTRTSGTWFTVTASGGPNGTMSVGCAKYSTYRTGSFRVNSSDGKYIDVSVAQNY